MTEAIEDDRPYWEPRPRTPDDFDDVDREALDRALRLAKDSNDQATAQQIRELESEQGWSEGAIQAAYDLQCDHLTLSSGEAPPCFISVAEIDAIISRGPDADNGEYGSARLLKKMLAAGLSKYDPQPLDSLAAAQRKRKRP